VGRPSDPSYRAALHFFFTCLANFLIGKVPSQLLVAGPRERASFLRFRSSSFLFAKNFFLVETQARPYFRTVNSFCVAIGHRFTLPRPLDGRRA